MNNRIATLFLIFSLAPVVVTADPAETTETAEHASELGQSGEVLARQGEVELTQAEIDAAFSKIPVDKRLIFIRDGEKVEMLVRNLLRNKLLALEARKAGYDQETLVALRMSLAANAELAGEWIKHVVDEAPPADYETIAQERYLVDKDAWKSEDRLDVSHILISSERRSVDDAGNLAMAVWEELRADPSRFDALVEEYSEDPSKEVNGGRFPGVKKGDMVEPFEEAAFAIENQGDISLPVETTYGFHIIRLNRKMPGVVPPFEDIKAQAMEQVRNTYLDEYRTRYLRKLMKDPVVLPDGAVETMAKRYFGEDLELAPIFSE